MIFDYFRDHGYTPQGVTNAADFLIEVVVGGMKGSGDKIDWASMWRTSKETEDVKKAIAPIRSNNTHTLAAPSPPPLYQQIILLTQRTCHQSM